MIVSMFFGIAVNLNFSIVFHHNNDFYQDFFTFTRQNDSVHLFRDNNTIYLQCFDDSDVTIYNMTTESRSWRFTWPHTINKEKMSLVNGPPMTSFQPYDSLAFFDPIPDDELPDVDTYNDNCMYGYFAFCLPLLYVITKHLITIKRDTESNVTYRESDV